MLLTQVSDMSYRGLTYPIVFLTADILRKEGLEFLAESLEEGGIGVSYLVRSTDGSAYYREEFQN